MLRTSDKRQSTTRQAKQLHPTTRETIWSHLHPLPHPLSVPLTLPLFNLSVPLTQQQSTPYVVTDVRLAANLVWLTPNVGVNQWLWIFNSFVEQEQLFGKNYRGADHDHSPVLQKGGAAEKVWEAVD